MSKDPQPLEEMFPDLISQAKWLGFSIANGWRPLIIEALKAFKDNLVPDDLKLFRLVQVKEKFGTLRMYYEASGIVPVDMIGPDGVSRLEVDIDEGRVRLSEEGRAIVRRIIEQAENKAARTCEDCGAPGRFYGGGYAKTLCDEHAQEDGKIFPRAYGELLETRPRRFSFPERFRDDDPIEDREAVCEHVLFYKGTRADVWYWSDDPKKEGWIFLTDVPDRFINAFFDWKDGHPEETHSLPYSAPDNNQIQTLYVDDFLATLSKVRQRESATSILEPFFTMPAGVKVDPRTQMERDIAEIHDLDVSINSLVPVISLGGFAVGMMTASQLPQLFKVSDKVMGPEMIDTPIRFLQSELGQIEKMKTRIEAALKVFEDKK